MSLGSMGPFGAVWTVLQEQGPPVPCSVTITKNSFFLTLSGTRCHNTTTLAAMFLLASNLNKWKIFGESGTQVVLDVNLC